MLWYLVFATLCAGVVEEVIFRGFLVVENKGRVALIGSCIGFSLYFCADPRTLLEHGGRLCSTFTSKAFFTTAILFANSLWWYAVRFAVESAAFTFPVHDCACRE